jgi:coenzyme Q-binding protein COQ10
VGFGLLPREFGTLVGLTADGRDRCYLISGPFPPAGEPVEFSPHEQGTTVDFFIDLQLKSKLLQGMVDANADKVTGKIVKGFEARARQLYGDQAAA